MLGDAVAKKSVESSDTPDSLKLIQLQKIEVLNQKTSKNYLSNMPNNLSGKLQEMEQRLQQRQKELEALQVGR